MVVRVQYIIQCGFSLTWLSLCWTKCTQDIKQTRRKWEGRLTTLCCVTCELLSLYSKYVRSWSYLCNKCSSMKSLVVPVICWPISLPVWVMCSSFLTAPIFNPKCYNLCTHFDPISWQASLLSTQRIFIMSFRSIPQTPCTCGRTNQVNAPS